VPQRRLLHLAVLAALLLTFTLSVHAADYAELDALILTKDVSKIQSAIDGLKELLGQNPDDGEALWLLSKAYLYLGDRTEEGRLKVFETGKKYADQCLKPGKSTQTRRWRLYQTIPMPTIGFLLYWAELGKPGAS